MCWRRPYLLFENNTFSVSSGEKQDVVDFTTSGPTPVIRFIGNTFLGGGDDGLDLDGTNAYIEGNTFMNFHKGFSEAYPGEYGESTPSPPATTPDTAPAT